MRYVGPGLAVAAIVLLALGCSRLGGTLPQESRRGPEREGAWEEEDEGGRGSEAEERKDRQRYFHRLLRDPATDAIPPRVRKRELAFVRSDPRLHRVRQKGASDTWTEVGPSDVGGRTRALALDVRDSNVVIAGAVSGGVWKSTDGGLHWRQTTTDDQQKSVTSLAQDPRPGHQDVWYYASGEAIGNSAQQVGSFFFGSGVYKSVDNGETWSLLPVTDLGDFVRWDSVYDLIVRVAVSPVTGAVFLASNGYGVLRSTDGGATFQHVLGSGARDYTWAEVAVASDGAVVAVLSNDEREPPPVPAPGVWTSTSDGAAASWTLRTPAVFPEVHDRSVVGVAPGDPDLAYVFTHLPDTGGFSLVRMSLSSGAGEDLTAKVSNFGGRVGTLDVQSGYNMVVAVKPDDENFVLVGGTNLYRTTNAFATKETSKNKAWIGGYATANNVSQYVNHHPDNHVAVFDPHDPKRVWSAHDGGLSLGLDAAKAPMTWIDVNDGYNVTQCYTVAIPPAAGDGRFMCGTQDNGTPFRDWTKPAFGATKDVSTGDGAYAQFTAPFAYASAQGGVVLRLRYDAQGTPKLDSTASGIWPLGAEYTQFIHPFAVDPADEDVMYYPDGDHLWRNAALASIPNGRNGTNTGWVELNNVTTVAGDAISTLAVSTEPPHDLFYASGWDPFYYSGAVPPVRRPRLFVLHDATAATNGEVDISDTGWPTGAWIGDIAVNPEDSSELLVVMTNYNIVGVWHTTNQGASWTAVEGNLEGTPETPGPSIRSAAILPTAPGGKEYILGTSTGVYTTRTLSGGATAWVQEAGDSIGNTVVSMVRARASDNLVAAGAHGRGVFVRQSLAACGDGEIQTGEECDDGNTEPGDGCDAECQEEPPCSDADGDGYRVGGPLCLPADCDDAAAAVHPGASEQLCTGRDEDCDAGTPDGEDPLPLLQDAVDGGSSVGLAIGALRCAAGLP